MSAARRAGQVEALIENRYMAHLSDGNNARDTGEFTGVGVEREG